MCHGYEWEMLKKSYAEEMARRQRELDKGEAKGSTVTPPKAPEQAPRVRDKEPIPV
jgi:hypothetical protein